MGRVLRSALGSALFTLASTAAAQPATSPAATPTSAPPAQPPAYPPPPYPPGYYLAYPPPYAYPAPQAPPRPPDDQLPGYHLHDRLFMRLAGGLGYLNVELEPNTNAVSKVALKGFGIGFEFDLGWAIAPGVIVGGAYGGALAPDARGEHEQNPRTNDTLAFTLGPFIDFFPDPRDGLEIGGSFGLGRTAYIFEDPQTLVVRDESILGFGGSLWAGYSGWVSANWSFGVLVRGGIAWLEGRQTVETSTAIIDFDQSGKAWTLGLLINPVFN